MTTWITPEEAAQQINNQVSAETLKTYPTRSQKKITAEERFAKLGLLFDRERWLAGKEAFLKIIVQPEAQSQPQPAADKATTTDTPSKTDTQSDSEAQDEPYDLEKCTIRIVFTFFPKPEADSDRQVMLAASTHEDLPIADVVQFSELEPLSQPIIDILAKLEADLPNRRYRAEVRAAKANKKPRRRQPQTITTTTQSETEPQATQIKLFGL
ncbi:MAG: hypothetical protein F6J89_24300 [Symploca sp. SIO1C4]|uniref:Uncharacterized protein n=1 Tax=Symploca sp. SIO1C4 TaxID=2607765 RepID=A0A6B3NJL8_9CYAN|nr:hypothetical protein [Symploca sp. SIO1C4]